ncbi:lipoate--protein ligase [Terrilactibacillus laevilacticus]|uniref:lipoate--protein ligase n=1 Tax=Terrilactibacillus laevilacticus TaxID=1380157 RepID=A0ABW5PQL9_9BACI|nr:lipoate--protein ligase [Terrilactibacillus laevilacticus]
MKYIDNKDNLDIAVSFAIEEFALTELDPNETYFLFYRMKPTVIVGKNQNTVEEINMNYVNENHVNVIRRLSGGGAVYNDEGNLSFSFITKDDGNSFSNYRKFTDPIVRALHQFGVNASFQGRNDLVVGGKKISGNAQFATKGRIFSHGTLLFDVNLDNVAKALNPDNEKFESKGIKSVRSRVINIRELMSKDMDIQEFKQHLLNKIFEEEGGISEYKLSKKEWEKIYELADKRYRNWDWVYGRSPEFNVKYSKRFSGGRVDIRLNVKNGYISSAKIFGDFFAVGDISELEEMLIGLKYTNEDIKAVFNKIDTNYYFGKVTKEELISML